MDTIARLGSERPRRSDKEDTMFRVTKTVDERGAILIQDPPIARFLFQSTAAAWLWLVVRVWMGYQWLTSGWGKLNNPEWMETGQAILGYWQRAVAIPAAPARPLITYDWYRSFLQFLIDTNAHPWFAKLIVFGELLIGLGLVVGALVGIAAFFGALLNLNFMLAGTVSTNPTLFLLSILLVLAWKNAGYLGLDRYLLPALGTPWQQRALERPTAVGRGGAMTQAI
jgi:thiosulfate dehydrogenase [quinone] large subunit